MRAVGLAFLVAVVWFSPRICRADPIRFRPSVSVGGAVGLATQKVTCSASGSFECALPPKRERSLGLQAAPYVEALVMAGRRIGFRLGLGVRYVPGFAQDTGSELHFAVVPELMGQVSRDRYAFVHLFNALGYGFPTARIRERQAPTLDGCSTLSTVEGAHCAPHTSNIFASAALEAGLLDRVSGAGLRYGIGLQALIEQNVAFAHGYSGDTVDDSKDMLDVRYATETWRFVAFAGVEW